MATISERYRTHPRVLAIVLLGDGRFRRIYRNMDYELSQYTDGSHPYGPSLHEPEYRVPRTYCSLTINGQRVVDRAILEHIHGRRYPRLNVYRVMNPHQATFFVPDCAPLATSQ